VQRRDSAPATPYKPAGTLGPAGSGDDGAVTIESHRRVRVKSHTTSLWRGGRLIIKGRVYGAFSSASSPRYVTLQIWRHGAWRSAARPRLDKRGRFVSRPHLRRAKRAKQGHSTLRLGRGYVPFAAKTLKVRARVSGKVHSVIIRVQLRH